MAERAAQVGGRLMVDTTPGQGTRVRVEVEL
jgi:signal transduction histidine kinase